MKEVQRMKKKCSALLLAGFLAFGAGQISMADYMVGSRGPEVQNIQRRLISNGYRLKADGNYNSQTSAAVKKFQFKKHLDVDGIVGPATYKAIMEEAKKYVGVPYQFGGTTPRGFDCSGFIQYVFNRKGIVLPRGADEQYSAGRKVSVNALKPGDLVYFQTYAEGISHSGLYLGDGYFISATSSQGVAVATMKSGYWHDRYMGANRVL